jgi:hypothetical protein
VDLWIETNVSEKHTASIFKAKVALKVEAVSPKRWLYTYKSTVNNELLRIWKKVVVA